MAVKFLQSILGHTANTIVRDLSYDIERRLVELNLATYTLSGGVLQTKKTVIDGLSSIEQNLLIPVESIDATDGEFPVKGKRNGVTGGSTISGRTAMMIPSPSTGLVAPYKYACFGDSRLNFTGRTNAAVHGQGLINTLTRSPTYTLMYTEDMEACFSGSLSGDTVATTGVAGSGWANPARTYGKTIAAMAATAPDIVDIEYGINDFVTQSDVVANFATYVTTVSNGLKGLVLACIQMGAKVAFQEIVQCTEAFYVAQGDAVTRKNLCNAINSEMQAFIASLNSRTPGTAAYVPVNQVMTLADGYGDPAKLADGIHDSDLGARLRGKMVAEYIRALLPRKNGAIFSALSGQPNLLRSFPRLTSTQVATTTVSGTFGTPTFSFGYDAAAGEDYIDMQVDCTALASGTAQIRVDLYSYVGSYGGATPDFSIATNDWVQCFARAKIGANVGALDFRLRAFKQSGGSDFADQGDAVFVPATNLPEGEVWYLRTPRVQLTAGSSGIEAPGVGKGLQMVLFVRTIATGVTSIRLYSPAIRKAA